MLYESCKASASSLQCNGTQRVDRCWNLRRRLVAVLTAVIEDLENDGAVQKHCT